MAARALIALCAAILAAPAVTAAAPVELRWVQLGEAPGQGELRVEGLPAPALARLPCCELEAAIGESLLRVAVADSGADAAGPLRSLPNVWGVWTARDGVLAFRPRHVLAPGATLHAAFSGATFDTLTGSSSTPDATLRLDLRPGESVATVIGALPNGDEIPENLLRVYLEFSHPMSMRGVERQVRLLDSGGVEIPAAFVEVPGGLWDPARRRLTLLVHPGRQKSGLAMRERLGPVLVGGASVTLVVDAAARDAEGRSLARPFSRTWRVGPPRNAPLDPGRWILSPPAAPRGSLVVQLPWPLDSAISRRALAVLDARGEAVPAALDISPDGRELRFAPAVDWRPGETYRLRVDAFLEDPSGNRLGRAFETASHQPDLPVVRELAFVPLPPASAFAVQATHSQVRADR